MNDKKTDDKKMPIDENIELSYEEKVQGQLDCLKKANEVLRKVIERHESQRNRN